MDALGLRWRGFEITRDAAASEAEQNAQQTLFDMSRLNLSNEEHAILERLNSEPVHVEELIQHDTAIGRKDSFGAVISFSLKGLVKQLPGNMLVKRHPVLVNRCRRLC